MTGLVGAEIRRLWSRRFYRAIVALFVAGFLFSGTFNFVTSRRNPDPGVLRQVEANVASCERYRAANPTTRFECPTVSQLLQNRFDFADTMPTANRAGAVMMLVAGFVLGASFVGAEWGAGTITTLLTWEPRRAHVMASKLAGGALLLAVTALVLLATLTLLHYPAAAFRGTTEGTTGSLWWSLMGLWARGAALAALGSWAGAGLAMLSRNTAGAVGAGLVYVAFVDPILATWRGGRLMPWLLLRNVPRFLGLSVGNESASAASAARAGLLLSAYVLAVAAAGYAAFRARDVT